MWRCTTLLLVAAFAGNVHAGNEALCSINPGTYAGAKQAHPDMAFALDEVAKRGVATWYTDRSSSYADTAKQIVAACPSSSRMNMVVYGLPHKDCEAGMSSGGSVQDAASYRQFLGQLTQTIGDRKVLYIVEPDALGLLAKSACAKTFGYEDSLAIAIQELSKNPNADLYLDVGHWVLGSASDRANVVAAVKRLQGAGRLKGVSINTSNYRSNAELSSMCASFRAEAGDNMHCVLDTSRNYNGPSHQDEWCNFKDAGIGKAPTGTTGDANIDYYVWAKVPGESDGQCSGRTSDALQGPAPGDFFADYFKQLWNNGAMVKDLGMPLIDGNSHSVTTAPPAPTTQAPAPTTQAPAPTTQAPAPTTQAPAPTTQTPAPTTEVPATKPAPIDQATTAPPASTAPATVAPKNDQPTTASPAEDHTTTAPPASEDPEATPKPTPALTESMPTPAVTGPVSVLVNGSDAHSGNDTEIEAVPTTPEDQTVAKPTLTVTSTSASSSGSSATNEITTKATSKSALSTGLIVLMAMIGVAVVALAVVVSYHVRQASVEEVKTPVEETATTQFVSENNPLTCL